MSEEFICREITFREKVYPDGLRVLSDIRATCEDHLGQPIPYLTGAQTAKKFRQAAAQHELEFDGVLVSLLTSPHWPEWQVEDRLLEPPFECVYLSESKSNEPERSRRRQEAHNRKYLGLLQKSCGS